MEKILFVDDERNVLEGIQRHLRKRFTVEVAQGGPAGLEALATQGPFAIVVSDFRMPGMDGVHFLAKVKERTPDTVRMMLTGQADMNGVIDAINQGAIFRFITKPTPPESLIAVLEAGLAQYRLIRAEKELLEETLTGSLKALSDVLALVNPEAFGRASRLKRYVTGLAEHMNLSSLWQYEIAAMLSQIGTIVLPPELQEKINKGQQLTSNEIQAMHQCPASGADLIANIPRMGEIAAMIAYQHKHYDGSGIPHDDCKEQDIPLGARLLKVALDFDSHRIKGLTRHEAHDQLVQQSSRYDPAVLQALKTVFVPEEQYRTISVTLKELTPNMILAEEVTDEKGALLVAKGYELTDWMIERLRTLSKQRPVKQPIGIMITENEDANFGHK